MSLELFPLHSVCHLLSIEKTVTVHYPLNISSKVRLKRTQTRFIFYRRTSTINNVILSSLSMSTLVFFCYFEKGTFLLYWTHDMQISYSDRHAHLFLQLDLQFIFFDYCYKYYLHIFCKIFTSLLFYSFPFKLDFFPCYFQWCSIELSIVRNPLSIYKAAIRRDLHRGCE